MEDTLHTTGGERETPTQLQTLPATRVDGLQDERAQRHKSESNKLLFVAINAHSKRCDPCWNPGGPEPETMDRGGFTSVLLKEHSSKMTPDNVLLDS